MSRPWTSPRWWRPGASSLTVSPSRCSGSLSGGRSVRMTWSWWVVGALIEDEEADGAGWHDGDVPPDMEIVESHVHGAAERRGLVPPLHGEEDHERERRRHERERPRPATPRPSPCHPVPLVQMTHRFYCCPPGARPTDRAPSAARAPARRQRWWG